MHRYKIFFYDRDINAKYPVTILKEDINDLCEWLNRHTKRWNLEVIHAQLVDPCNKFIGHVELLPTEITIQSFITSLPERLIAYNEFENGGV